MRPAIVGLLAMFTMNAQPFTRGVGVYPGDPREDFAPAMERDTRTYRNLAVHRPAYQSSAYDYNLTAQLVTDGIKDDALPRWLSVSTSDHGVLKKQEREHPVDHNVTTTVVVNGSPQWIQLELRGGSSPLEVDRIEVTPGRAGFGRTATPGAPGEIYVVSGSDDGQVWKELGRSSPENRSAAPPARNMMAGVIPPPPVIVRFSSPSHNRFYRVTLEGGSTRWTISELALYSGNQRVEIGGPYLFTSAWKSGGSGEEWVYVDLGAECTFDRVVLNWIRRAAEGSVQVSGDAKSWRTIQTIPAANGPVDDLKLAQAEHGRYVRILMTKPGSPDGYILSEVEVYGRGGPMPHPHAAATADASGRLRLSGGAWRIQRDSLVSADGQALSQTGFPDREWLVATVPATVLSSYWNAGALPDPNFGRNQLAISDSFFYADFWYRNEFTAPLLAAGRHAWLSFRGINWKADVYLNGQTLGSIDGGFIRGQFDVTRVLKPGARNAIALRIHKNATPGSAKEKTWENPDLNGGALGADNPTYHATIGWDWIPTVRGRDIGIWSDIYLDTTGPVQVENPLVITTLPLPDTNRADVQLSATLRNNGSAAVSGTLHGRFGGSTVAMPVNLEAGAEKVVRLDPLHLQNPKLWWPAGYGDQNLYDVQVTFETTDGKVSDTKSFRTGVRQFTYSGEGNEPLKIYINGRRFVARGGNWGFPEVNLRYRAREYDAAVRYHKDMNFTMIRNWVGQTGDDEFFDACDKNGIVIWQDFWLANPVDGPNPDDNELFLKNSRDFILRIRNHPSIGIYCGRNEGNPPQPLDDGLKQQVAELHPGLHYIPNSAFGPVSGGGPYRNVPPKQYFQTRATTKLHSELGMPNIVNLDSLKQMMPEEDTWPQGDDWGIHDFTMTGAQGGSAWRETIDAGFGGAKDAAEWVELSQFINYDGYRAIFEAQSKNRMGVLLWMSHPCWPSFVWQTYDYYFDPTAGYFGSKKGSEPLHIQWNPLSDTVEVVNYSAGNATRLTASVQILNMDGTRKWERSATLDSLEDSVSAPIRIEYPAGLTPVHFLRLRLTQGSRTVSDNFYMRSLNEVALPTAAPRGPGGGGGVTMVSDFRAIRELPRVKVEAETTARRSGSQWILTTELRNASGHPALMVRVRAVRERSGDRILPALYSDNYVALMPGEHRTIRTELEEADTRGERPRIVAEGFNTERSAD